MKQQLYFYILFFFSVWLSHHAVAQNIPNPRQSFSWLTEHVEQFNRALPQEKAYLHFDNTGYFMDETIWFKAYVVSSDSNLLSHKSRLLYVELLDPSGNVVKTRRVELTNGTGFGEFRLTNLFIAGFYEVRAYTRYMLNWGDNVVFSRVFPVFRKPEKEGDYSRTILDEKEHLSRLPNYRESDERTDASHSRKLHVAFFPEGGTLVEGLESNVAFSVTDGSDSFVESDGILRTADGRALSSVNIIREGRGVFRYTPGKIPAELVFADRRGREQRFELPKAEKIGCVMTVNACGEDSISVCVVSQGLSRRMAGLCVSYHGRPLLTDSLWIDGHTATRTFPKSALHDGVNQITLFDRKGRVLSDRMVFVHPRRGFVQNVDVSIDNSVLWPYGNVNLKLRTPEPNINISLSVRDADTQVNGTNLDIVTWILLASDLRGYIHRPAYYLECDDEEHRRAADLLMMVQGWRGYDFEMMDGLSPMQLKHPAEDGLYLLGQLHPYKKKDKVGGVTIDVTLYNQDGDILSGTTTTNDKGYYVFKSPDCWGAWTMLMQSSIDEKAQKYYIGLNRQFSPSPRTLSLLETQPTDSDVPANLLKEFEPDLDEFGEETITNHLLETVEVEARRKQSPRAAWESQGAVARHSRLRYNCTAEADAIIDQGKPMPTFIEWLKKKNPFIKGSDNISGMSAWHNDSYNLMDGGMSYQNLPIVWVVNNRFMFATSVPTRFAKDPGDRQPDYDGRPPFPVYLDEVEAVYITEHASPITRFYMYNRDLEVLNCIGIFVYTYHQPYVKKKGMRRTHFEGYDMPNRFYINNYNVMPREKDFRRTLYWNPDVPIGNDGTAVLSFFNNSSCRQLLISAEGIDKNGKPLLGR